MCIEGLHSRPARSLVYCIYWYGGESGFACIQTNNYYILSSSSLCHMLRPKYDSNFINNSIILYPATTIYQMNYTITILFYHIMMLNYNLYLCRWCFRVIYGRSWGSNVPVDDPEHGNYLTVDRSGMSSLWRDVVKWTQGHYWLMMELLIFLIICFEFFPSNQFWLWGNIQNNPRFGEVFYCCFWTHYLVSKTIMIIPVKITHYFVCLWFIPLVDIE